MTLKHTMAIAVVFVTFGVGAAQAQGVPRGAAEGAAAGDAADIGVRQVRGHAGALGPEAPGEGEGGEVMGAAVSGEGVEEAEIGRAHV